MKWLCAACRPDLSITHDQPCPECCGFRKPVEKRLFQPGRVTESRTGSWVPDRHGRSS